MPKNESVPSFEEPLRDEAEATRSHIGNGGFESASEDTVILSDPEDGEKEALPEDEVEFAKPISDEEFEKRKIIKPIIAEIEDFVDKAKFIPADLYTKAQILNDPFLNDYILSLPDNTVVFLDQYENKTKTILQIRETYTALNEQKNIEQKKKLDAQLLEEITAHTTKSANQPDTTKNNAENPNRGISLKNIKISPKGTVPSIETPSISESTPISTPIKNESTPTSGTLENLLSSAETKDDLIAIIERSNDLQDGLWGTQQIYSRDELIALIEATWIGDVGIDHLPRTAGFREAVDRVREYERVHLGKYVERRTTAAELDPVIQAGIKMGDALGVPESSRIYDHNKEDNSLVYNYIKNPATEEAHILI